MLVHFQFEKTLLKNFEIIHELPFEFSLPVNFTQRDFANMNSIEDLAVDGSCAKLFDFCDV